jgi:hypothetical protein
VTIASYVASLLRTDTGVRLLVLWRAREAAIVRRLAGQ